MDLEADQAFQDLKRYLTSPPVIKPLVLYLAATPYSASTALVAVREEPAPYCTLSRGDTGPRGHLKGYSNTNE